MPKIPIISAKDFLNYLIRYGCVLVSVRGSHHKLLYPQTGKRSVIAIHSSSNVDRGTFAGVLTQLGINIEDFITHM